MHKLNKANFDTYLAIARSLTFDEALLLLNLFDPVWTRQLVYRDNSNPLTILFKNLYPDGESKTNCKHLTWIWFKGGPPGKEKWVCGPINYYVADVLLHEAVFNGDKYVIRVIKNFVMKGAP